ncbi:protein O-glucosyltransferase 2 [Lampetra fluviatilis]
MAAALPPLLLLLLLLAAVATPCASGRVPSANKCLVWGPGLHTAVVLPARYFFVQAVDKSGENFTSSPGEGTFKVKLSAADGAFLRAWVQVLDRHDGSFLVRYKLYASYTDLRVEVTYRDKHIAKSPYTLRGEVYNELCACPRTDGDRWYADMGCRNKYPQIARDLEPFPAVDLDHVAREAPKRFGQWHSLCHYTIKDNKVYRRTFGQHVDFKMFMDAMLLSLTRKVWLPDMEFFVNLGDWPLEKGKAPDGSLLPIFSWCGSEETRDIVMPTYDLTESVLETMGRVSLDLMSVQANTGPAWANKTERAFWRGRDSRQERLDLVKMVRSDPNSTIDAAITHFFFFKHDESLYGPTVPSISFFDFFKFKYQLNIDGTVAAYRLPYLLAGDSLVLKQESPYYEHFYSELRPWEHYVPFRRDLGDLQERLRWAQEHDDEARQIAKRGQQYVRNNLMSDQVFCYHYSLFQEYARRQTTKPKVWEDMEAVEQPPDEPFPCSCHRAAKEKDEL